MVLNVHRNHKANQGRGEGGGGGYGGGGRLYTYRYTVHCHHQNDFCIKVGSDESPFNVSLIVRGNVTRQCPQTTTFEEKGEPKRIQTEVPLLTNQLTDLLTSCKLQALVYDILPSTTAVFSYTIGSRKLSANEQGFFLCFFFVLKQ